MIKKWFYLTDKEPQDDTECIVQTDKRFRVIAQHRFGCWAAYNIFKKHWFWMPRGENVIRWRYRYDK